MPGRLLEIACGALALCAACAAFAQENAQGPAAAPDAREAPAEVEEIVVQGVRTGEFEGEPTAFGDVIETDAYDAEGKSVADLLAETPGVYVRRFGAAGDPAEVSIRGSAASQVVVAIDGVRANSALTGGIDLTTVCLPLVSEVEIARGAGATREGSGAIGGVVNLVTRGARETPESRAGFSAGSFDTYQGSLFHAGRAGPLDYSLGYCGLGTEGDFEFARPEFIGPDGVPAPFDPPESQRINNERTQHGATLGLGAPLGPGSLRFGDFFTHSHGGEPGIDCCNGEDAGQNPEAESTGWNNLAQLRYETPSLGPAHTGLTLSLYHHYEENEFRDPLQVFGDPIHVTAHIGTLGSRAESSWQLELGPSLQDLGVELDLARDDFGSDDAPGRDRQGGSLRLSDEISLWDGRALLVPALRGELTEGFGSEWIPAAGLVLSPLPWLRLRANATRAFRIPSFDELYLPDQGFIAGNPDLDPEQAWNFDAGFELVLERLGPVSEVRLGASWFRREIDDSIVWVQVSPTRIEPVNTGAATAQGVELSLAFQITRYLRVMGNHTELDTERDSTGERLPGQPERESYARVQLGPPEQWKLVGEYQRTGDILVSEGGGRTLSASSVWNASAAWNLASLRALPFSRWLSRLWVYAEMNNIGDEAVRDTLAFPQPGRNATVGVQGAW